MDDLERLKRRLEREKAARKEAESILENKALELYEANQELIAIRDRQSLELEKQIKEIENKERMYRSIVQNASDLIYTCDITGNILYANATMVKRSGYSEEQLIGSNVQKYIPRAYKSKIQNFYAFQLEQKIESTYIEFPVYDAEGQMVWLGQTADLNLGTDITFNVLARDISDRKRMEKSLMISEEKYRSIIENMELGLLEVDREGSILKAYPKFCKLTGYTNEELRGKEAKDIFVPKEYQKVIQDVNSKRLDGESGVYEIELRRKDGSHCWVMISGAPYYNEKGQVAGSIGIHLDISDRKVMEEELRVAKKTAENSLVAKDRFLANISHEIRTPLNAIIGISELLMRSSLNEEQRKYLETIMLSGDNLLKLINEILDLSKIQSGKLKLREESVDLMKIMDHIYRSFDVIGSQKGLTIEFEHNLEEKQGYFVDGTRLKEVFFNIVGNAVKFTEEGSVKLSVSRASENSDLDAITFAIKDTGIGIPKEDIESIFSSFEQASNTHKGDRKGTGLGLSITKGIIESMGGQLKVESVQGEGSTFSFTLPLRRTTLIEDASEKEIDESDTSKLAGHRILVVEDVKVNRFLIRNILEPWGISIEEAVNGQEAIETLKTETFDLILMDVRMPVLDGIEATQKIRTELQLTEIPIVALTANAISGEKDKCFNAGMSDYLTKPYKQKDILAKLLKYLHKEENNEQPMEHLNLEGLKSITNGNEDMMHTMVALFVEETEKYIEQLQEAISESNIQRIQDIAHALKASVAHLCSKEVLAAVRSVEIDEVSEEQKIAATKAMIQLLEKSIEELRVEFSVV